MSGDSERITGDSSLILVTEELPTTRPKPHFCAFQNPSEQKCPEGSPKSRSGKPGLVEGASSSHLFEPRFIGH
jgi:hypothetical protein